jgi:hypothetical protein
MPSLLPRAVTGKKPRRLAEPAALPHFFVAAMFIAKNRYPLLRTSL